MRILGIDPGMAIIGYCVMDFEKDENRCEHYKILDAGSIQTNKSKTDATRLVEISEDLNFIIKKYNPEFASIEKLFYFKNAKTIIPVAEARGVILMNLEKAGIKIFEYTPLEIKQTITGFGRADKQEVCSMVKVILGDDNIPKLDDTTDAIAIAICYTRYCDCI